MYVLRVGTFADYLGITLAYLDDMMIIIIDILVVFLRDMIEVRPRASSRPSGFGSPGPIRVVPSQATTCELSYVTYGGYRG